MDGAYLPWQALRFAIWFIIRHLSIPVNLLVLFAVWLESDFSSWMPYPKVVETAPSQKWKSPYRGLGAGINYPADGDSTLP